MIFNHEDIKTLHLEKDYIDTAIVPVIEVDYTNNYLKIADELEMLQVVLMNLEAQFKGRLLLLPTIQQLKGQTPVHEVIETQLRSFGFKTILFVGPNHTISENIHFQKINIMPLSSMDDSMKQEFVQENVKLLMKSIIFEWNR
ncbi:DUF2487 family protein [Macrococcus sp. DPC7161]|uniref:DUF2487 family protein n=1 Tax=Macrococcus sp. DPC7161 TaxID=2507060 RepID=UPI00100B94CA|nr:DUF2487 family protein [Macrococcus sp. DPC7161]RXK19273.1 DUF2487 family protein [Macrococcus sp. DPC7161]